MLHHSCFLYEEYDSYKIEKIDQNAVFVVLLMKGVVKMQTTSVWYDYTVEDAVEKYGDVLFRIAFVMLKNKNDAEDAVQETMLKYLQKAPAFENAEHEKAWLIRVVTNQCKDINRF